MTDWWTMGVIAGPELRDRRRAQLLLHLQQALEPAALGPARPAVRADRGAVGVVVPEVVMSQGQLVATWQDARLFAAAAGAAAYYWRRDVLVTIVAGMAVYLPLHIGLGW
jgi:hypothetical protein